MAIVIFRLALFIIILTIGAKFLGEYTAKVMNNEKTFLSRILRPIEKFIYKILSINEEESTDWKRYAFNVITFSIFGFIFLFLLQKFQHLLFLNPQAFGPIKWDSAYNTTASFVSNTNWQSYTPEATMSYLTQMAGLAVQNFLSAATGIAVLFAFIRGFTNSQNEKIGNFWVDLTKSVIHILLPLSVIFSLFLVSQGVIQNFNKFQNVKTLQGQEQILPQGPTASQEAIKLLGTNGGGFFNANSSHPYENPTPLSDYTEIMALLIISMSLPFAFGAILKKRKIGYAIYSSMLILFILGISIMAYSEFHGNPILSTLGIQNGANLEGKEVRFGILNSITFANSTTVTSCGAVNSMHDSLMPLTSMVTLFNMMVGEVIFGGVGSGLIGFLLYAILAMFLVGLMIGRTPEIFGKKLEPFEMIMVMTALLVPSIIQLGLDAVALTTKIGTLSLNNLGPHGMSEILYAFASGAGNNGSAFAGLSANNVFYNVLIGTTMILARLAIIIPPLAIAGSLSKKKTVAEEFRFPTHGPLFISMLVFTIIIIGALTFFPSLVLSSVLEHLFIGAGVTF